METKIDITDGDLQYFAQLQEMAGVGGLDPIEASRYRVLGPHDVNWVELDWDWETAELFGFNTYTKEKQRLNVISLPEAFDKMRLYNEHINKCYASGLSFHDYPITDMLFIRSDELE